eukprot:1561239-Prymnesium_polylepis.1
MLCHIPTETKDERCRPLSAQRNAQQCWHLCEDAQSLPKPCATPALDNRVSDEDQSSHPRCQLRRSADRLLLL